MRIEGLKAAITTNDAHSYTNNGAAVRHIETVGLSNGQLLTVWVNTGDGAIESRLPGSDKVSFGGFDQSVESGSCRVRAWF